MRFCTVDDCDREVRARGLCSRHYRLDRLGRELTPERNCEACGLDLSHRQIIVRYCDNRCRQAAWRKRNAEKVSEYGAEYRRQLAERVAAGDREAILIDLRIRLSKRYSYMKKRTGAYNR